MKYSEIYNICMPEKKRKEERFNILAALIGRPISILITKAFINTSVKPTTITKISILASLIGFFLFCFANNTIGLLVGWIFFFAWNILDGVDGNLARCTNQCSPLGDLWDTMGGYAAMVLMYFGAGVASYYHPQLIQIGHSELILILGCATATISIFPRLVMHKRKSSNFDDDAVKSVSNKQNFGLSQIIALNFISPSGFMQIILLVCIIFGLLNCFVMAYFIINTLIMLISLRRLLR